MTGNHYANNQKDPYVSTTHIPVELTLYGLARYNSIRCLVSIRFSVVGAAGGTIGRVQLTDSIMDSEVV